MQGPERIRDIVRQRLSQLAPETAAAVELAAVAGPRFELAVLADAGGLDQEALLRTVEAGVHSGILEELDEPVPSCRFTHELVRRAVYHQLSRIRRTELHLRVGEALEQVHAQEIDRVLPELAHHFTLSAPLAGTDRGVEYILRSVRAATAAAAYEEAATQLETALELGITDPHERAMAQLDLAYVLFDTRRLVEAEAMTAVALDTATELGEREIAARLRVQRSNNLVFADPELDPVDVEPVAASAIETLREAGDEGGLALAERLLAVSLWRRGRAAESGVELERALVHADAAGEYVPLRQVVTTLAGVVSSGPMPVADAMRRCEELLVRYRSDRALEAVIARFLAFLCAMAARYDEARELATRSSLVLDRLESAGQAWVYRSIAAQTKELLGDLAGAEQEHAAKWASLRDARGGVPDARAMQAAYELGLLYCEEGRWDDAAECVAYGNEVPEPVFYRPEAVLRVFLEARLAAHDGALDEAAASARRGVEQLEPTDLLGARARAWLTVAEVERMSRHDTEADAAVGTALELYDAKGNVAAAARLRAAASFS
jgi:tetratricopeptide (TPR) repeat protein